MLLHQELQATYYTPTAIVLQMTSALCLATPQQTVLLSAMVLRVVWPLYSSITGTIHHNTVT